MKYLLIKNNKVDQIIVANEEFINSQEFNSYVQLNNYDQVLCQESLQGDVYPHVGWDYDGQTFTPPKETTAAAEEQPTAPSTKVD